jgi:WD40 repeat protein
LLIFLLSLSGDRFLVASQSPQAKVFDRDGKEILEFAKGYQYLADMAQTKGHISNITTAMWHPLDPSLVLTAGQDSTIRIWSVDNIKQQKTLIKVKNEKNLNKNPVSAITMDEAGKYLVVACQDSSIQLYPGKGPFLKATTRLPNAHMLGAEVSSLCVSKDGYTLLSRAMDDTMKVRLSYTIVCRFFTFGPFTDAR